MILHSVADTCKISEGGQLGDSCARGFRVECAFHVSVPRFFCSTGRLQSLFLDGRILEDGPGMAESCTQAVVKTAMQAGPIYFGERVHYFWSTCKVETRRHYMEALQSVGAVVRAMLERLDAEFPPQSLEQCFCVFDVAAAYSVAQSPESEWSVFETATECRILRLLRGGMGESDMGQMKAASRRFMSGLVRLMPRSSRTSNFKLH